jgi:hypothetical protein
MMNISILIWEIYLNNMNEMIIKLNEYGDSIVARVFGVEIKNKVLLAYNEKNFNKFIFDFDGVEKISTGFAKELFGELFNSMGENFRNLVEIRIPPENKLLKEIILIGLQGERNN